MGKNKADEGNYLQMWKEGIKKLNKHNMKIPYSTRWLYTHLHWLEHLYYDSKIDGFYRSWKDLHSDTGMGYREISKGIKILKDIGLIETWQMHWKDTETGEISEEHITAFRILEPEK